ncbi:MAG TPA: hypothetical protein VGS12_07535 [Caulobacteraceae bacterium]|nr:hypothetical protein [Caulobacteraceae bacterium]
MRLVTGGPRLLVVDVHGPMVTVAWKKTIDIESEVDWRVLVPWRA